MARKVKFKENEFVFYTGPHLIKSVYLYCSLKYTHRSDPKFDRHRIMSLIKDGLFRSIFEVDSQDLRKCTAAEKILYGKEPK